MHREWVRGAAIFAVVYLGHALCPIATQGDTRWNIPTALRLLEHGDADLAEYADRIAASGDYGIDRVGPHRYNYYPLAVPVVSLPFVAALRFVLPHRVAGVGASPREALFAGDLVSASAIVEVLVASVFVAGTAGVLYAIAREALAPGGAAALALLFAFGTSAWSVGSRALWQHTPSMFLNALALLCLVRLERSRWAAPLAGFSMALACYVRPTNALLAGVFGLYLSLKHWRFALEAIAGALPVAAAFSCAYLSMYGSPLAPYFRPGSMLRWHPEVVTAFAANLISPGRGLFVFLPFLLFLVWPAVWRTKLPAGLERLRPWLAVAVLLQMAVVALHHGWWGGFSYGPRYLSDVLPLLMFLWMPVLLLRRGIVSNGILAVLVLAAVFIHLRGATSIAVHDWNRTPVSVNDNRARIWDWNDPPFLRPAVQ